METLPITPLIGPLISVGIAAGAMVVIAIALSFIIRMGEHKPVKRAVKIVDTPDPVELKGLITNVKWFFHD